MPDDPTDNTATPLAKLSWDQLMENLRKGKLVQVPYVPEGGDHEIETIRRMVRLLNYHDPETRGRILRYLCDRYGTAVGDE